MDKKYLIYLFIILAILLFNPYPFEGGDNVVYSILAKSIVSGQGYASIYEPDSPPHVHYPPGFPVLLSPLVLIFGLDMAILKLIPFFSSVLAILIYTRLRMGDGKTESFATLFFAVSPIILVYSSRVLSEIPFTTLLIASIYFHQKKQDIIAWVCSVGALYIRTGGIFLVGGYLVYYLIERDWQRLFLSLLVMVGLYLPWFIRNRLVSDTPTYMAQFFMVDPYNPAKGGITLILLLKRLLTNLSFYLFNILPGAFCYFLQPVNPILGVFIIGLVGIGLFRAGPRLRFLKILVILFFIGLLSWPTVWSSDRFLLSGLSLIFPFLVIGIRSLAKSYGRYLIYVLALFSLISAIIVIPSEVRKKAHFLKGDFEYGYSLDWRRYRQACLWIKRNLPPGIIVSRKPEFTYLWTGYRSIIFPYSYDADEVWNGIKGYDYIIIDSFFWSGTSQKYLIPAILKHIKETKGLYRTRPPDTWVLAIRKTVSQ